MSEKPRRYAHIQMIFAEVEQNPFEGNPYVQGRGKCLECDWEDGSLMRYVPEENTRIIGYPHPTSEDAYKFVGAKLKTKHGVRDCQRRLEEMRKEKIQTLKEGKAIDFSDRPKQLGIGLQPTGSLKVPAEGNA